MPLVLADTRHDFEILSQRPDHCRFAFGEIGRAGGSVERVAVTGNHQVGAGLERR